MTPKELLEITILVAGGGGGAATGGFAFAMWQYGSKLERLQVQVEKSSFAEGRKLQQNIDHLLGELGVLKCEIRDIKAVLMRQGLRLEHSEFPEENIPKRTGWTIEDA